MGGQVSGVPCVLCGHTESEIEDWLDDGQHLILRCSVCQEPFAWDTQT